ncbi:hypothetical protein [Litorihabitans aurantiacus]|uniref:Uncharacterized protein n=1 Tax=Litorihabitans aurantiacus TaxID=1930061 RepID=A0AA38CU93_9MICO|nr:hypothetical protein [Litorihabitans aurantiacus]GMA33236.1 hypothetical protein GCM10025875_32280 [Litorihabitans aurantiacus]
MSTDTTVRVGQKLSIKGVTVTVTTTDVESIPKIRAALAVVAQRRGTITYGQLKVAASLTHAANGLGRLLDVVGVDCRLRGEPDLAALVVAAGTREVGTDYGSGAPAERAAVYARWAIDDAGAADAAASAAARDT